MAIDIQAFDTAYPGSMTPRKDGLYIEREDILSLAAAMLEGVQLRDRKIEDLEDALAQARQDLAETKTQRQQLHAALHDS